MTIREKCFTKATLAKIGHLDTVKEIFATLSQMYVSTDRYLEEILVPSEKYAPLTKMIMWVLKLSMSTYWHFALRHGLSTCSTMWLTRW